MDEPTTGLDPGARRSVWEIIKDYSVRGKTIILTTHYMEEAERLCDRIMLLNRGSIVMIGSPDDIKKRLGSYIKIRIPRYVFQDDKVRRGIEDLVSNIRMAGDWVELLVPKESREDIKKIVGSVLDVSIDLEIGMPSLEDIFL